MNYVVLQIPIELGILRNFEFVSQLRRSSVVVRQFGDAGASIFVKGAPESIKDICVAESRTYLHLVLLVLCSWDAVPSDYDDYLNHYTHKGYRVIACATKYEHRLSWMKVQKLTRVEAESNLEFVGFIIFENKLKPTTSHVISDLNRADIRNIMCTGDNILTAVSVARECKMIGADEQCFIPRLTGGIYHPSIRYYNRLNLADTIKGQVSCLPSDMSLVWESMDYPDLRLDPRTLLVGYSTY